MIMIELVVQMLVFKNTSDTRGMKPEIPIKMIMAVINMMMLIWIITMGMMLIMIMIELAV